jgi:hypothetical protein
MYFLVLSTETRFHTCEKRTGKIVILFIIIFNFLGTYFQIVNTRLYIEVYKFGCDVILKSCRIYI